jgi:phenylpropionate dioxygenase-like ring-hydroxylating dioxygenase large terminal subunit
MDRATQVALMRRIFGFLERRATEMGAAPYVNPVSAYTCTARLARERERLFRAQPLFVGLSRDAAAAGAYFVHADSGVPILVVRAVDGALRAFVALCRHRGAQLAEGEGVSSGRFTCPYHGWTYDDRGALVAQPCREGFAGIDPGSLGLAPLPIAERHGMIFVRPGGGEPIDVDAHLGGAAAELAALGLDRYVRFARRAITPAINWKLAVDTFLEAYHVPSLHQDSLGAAILGCAAAWDAFGSSGRMVATRRSIAALRERPEPEWDLLAHAVVLWQLFPNTVLIHQIDHVEIVQAYPGPDPASAQVVFALYTPEAAEDEKARRHFQRNFDLLLRVSAEEDFRLCERIQRGFAASDRPVVFGRNEPGLAHYHRMIAAALEDGGTAG